MKPFSRIKTLKNIRDRTKEVRRQQGYIEEELESDLLKKFTSFMTSQHLKYLKTKLFQYYGKNFTIDYKPSYGFSQQWEGGGTFDDNSDQFSAFENQNVIFSAFTLIRMCLNFLLIWMNTIETFFMGDQEQFTPHSLAVIGIFVEITDLIIRITIKNRSQKCIAIESYRHIIVIIYLSFKAIGIDNIINNKIWSLIEWTGIYFMYQRASNIYRSFRLLNITLLYEYQFKVLDLMLNLIIIAHFISIALFEVTKLNFDTTWITVLGITNQPPLVKYVYSFYFCTTTILTVGYGDISPRNYAEVLVVTCVEIFGIILFAYFISQIGYSLSALRKNSEAVEKDLLTIQRIKKWYKLDDLLERRARAHIIGNRPTDTQLSPQQQKGLMQKLSDQLRTEIKLQNAHKIVKSCVFYLVRWSTALQNAVSLRLCSIIFPPGQLIYQPTGRERIYIIRDGRIDIYASKRGAKRGSSGTILKTIDNTLDTEVSNSIYGYTAIISRRPVQLYAVAKRHVSAYYVQKDKFMECIRDRQEDFEYYHQLKEKIDESPCWEALQVPRLDSTKHHYNPTRTYLVRKHNRAFSEQTRSQFIRNHNRRYRLDLSSEQRQKVKAMVINGDVNSGQIQQPTKKTLDIIDNKQELSLQKVIDDNLFICQFQSGKQYSNYLPRNNKYRILHQYQTEFGYRQKLSIQKNNPTYFDALKDYRDNIPFQI